MSKKLAIKGHSTRYKEIIELFEMMGGIADNIRGNIDEQFYFIHENGRIHTYTPINSYPNNNDFCKFTLEEFLEKYPFKVGDKVRDGYGNILTIKSMKWSEDCETMVYDFKDSVIVLAAEDLLKYNNTSNAQPRHMYLFNPHDFVVVESCDKKQKWICEYKSYVNDQLHFYKGTYDICSDEHGNKNKLIYNSFYDVAPSDIIRVASPGETTRLERMIEKHNKTNHIPNVLAELLDHIKTTSKEDLEKEFKEIEEWSNVGPTVEEFMDFCEKTNKKPKYPKTYNGCCEVLNLTKYPPALVPNKSMFISQYKDFPHYYEIQKLAKLLICRDAYWKIAGEELGLGKPWEPNWKAGDFKWCMSYSGNYIEFDQYKYKHHILAFPTEEMRNMFYENFKELIEECKELL